jgi:hypothetical protein
MSDRDQEATSSSGPTDSKREPPRSRLSRILAEQPEARPRLRRAVSSLIATALVAITAIGILLIWHFRRRAQLIRERLSPPREVTFPDLRQVPVQDANPPEAGA